MELPSRFQIGEVVKYVHHEWAQYTIEEVIFTESKIIYALRGKEALGRLGVKFRADSHEVERLFNKN